MEQRSQVEPIVTGMQSLRGFYGERFMKETILEWVRTSTAYTYAEVQQKWKEILDDVDKFYVAPSFASKNTQY